MTKDEALRLALDALSTSMYPQPRQLNAIAAIKAALEAKDEPEYYGLTKDHLWMSISKEHYDRLKPEFRMACYTTPPQRKPLTVEEIAKLDCYDHLKFARAIEAAHGIKGEA